jgi:hypothetical protein
VFRRELCGARKIFRNPPGSPAFRNRIASDDATIQYFLFFIHAVATMYPQYNSWRPSLATIALSSVATVSAFCLYQCVSQYGWEGTYWFIWEGSPYPPQVREEFRTLDDVEDSLEAEARILDRLEEAYERAQLDSIEGASDATLLELWNINLPKRNLEKLISRLSYNLDLYASKVDAVPSSKQSDLKIRKKNLSSRIVELMKRADVYVAHYQAGQQKDDIDKKP